LERIITPASISILLLGLLFVAGGFGTFVAGHVEGLLVVFVGVAMLWAGWVGSQARGLASLAAASLNIMDAAVTLASWNYEVNPLVLSTGPTLFVVAKLLCSVAIVLYARTAPSPNRGGYVLAIAFALILAWNLSQFTILSYHTRSLSETLFWGTASSMLVAFATFMALAFRHRHSVTF
jgi:hypothetical protein